MSECAFCESEVERVNFKYSGVHCRDVSLFECHCLNKECGQKWLPASQESKINLAEMAALESKLIASEKRCEELKAEAQKWNDHFNDMVKDYNDLARRYELVTQ